MTYTQENISTNYFRRIFSEKIDSSELEWHRDHSDRRVIVIKGGGWKFQEDNKLPINLIDGMELHIPKETFHRVFKGTDELIIEIEEIKNE